LWTESNFREKRAGSLAVGPAEGSQGRMANAAGKGGMPHHSVDAYGVKESSWAGGTPTHQISWPGGWRSRLFLISFAPLEGNLVRLNRQENASIARLLLNRARASTTSLACLVLALATGQGIAIMEPMFVPSKGGREVEEKRKLKNQRNVAPAGQSWTTAPRFAGNHGSAQADLAWRERMSHEQGMSKAQQLKAKLERAMVGKRQKQDTSSWSFIIIPRHPFHPLSLAVLTLAFSCTHPKTHTQQSQPQTHI
jgi:hypothetical protein